MEKAEFEDLRIHELDDNLCHVMISEALLCNDVINIGFLDGPLKGKRGRIDIDTVD